jgi:HSP20 family protein
MAIGAQTIPVRLYNSNEQMILAAPLPGLQPENISITIAGKNITIEGDERGPHQHERDLIVDEWTFGPYHREISLPEPVDGSLTNATYSNGVLVLAMPKCKTSESPAAADFQLHPIAAAHGERIGHTGSSIQPTSSSEHEKKHQSEKKARRS